MTSAELMTALTTLLSAQLGTYTLPAGTTVPAIYNGEPPSDWVASGVEVRVDPAPEYANEALHVPPSEALGILAQYTLRIRS